MSNKDPGTARKGNSLLLFVATCLLSLIVFHLTGVLLKPIAGILAFIHDPTPSAQDAVPISSTAASCNPTISSTSSSPAIQSAKEPLKSPSCTDSYICQCEEEGRLCYRIVVSPDTSKITAFICSHGLYLRRDELKDYAGFLYRSACRPRDMPPLKDCRLGETCDSQNLPEGHPCMAGNEQVAICHCGLVLNITTPEMRENVNQIRCHGREQCDPPPMDSCDPPPFGSRDPISL